MKTIDINAKEWFDKTYGNSYFSAQIIIDYGMDTEKKFELGYQYGYGDHYIDMAKQKLQKEGLVPIETISLWRYCDENKIILRTSKQKNCLKRDVKSFGKE